MNLLITGDADFIGTSFVCYILNAHLEDVIINLENLALAHRYLYINIGILMLVLVKVFGGSAMTDKNDESTIVEWKKPEEELEKDLESALKKKLDVLDHTRHNRLYASERLKGYAIKWNIIIFLMNIEVVFLVIYSLVDKGSKYVALFSGCFSLYVVLLQYYLSTLNYEARSLKFHYEQLAIENLRLELKNLLFRSDSSYQKKANKYTEIMRVYQESLDGNENHDSIDERKFKYRKSDIIIHDFSIENIFLYVHLLMALIIIILLMYTFWV